MKADAIKRAIGFMGGPEDPKPTLIEYAQIKTEALAELTALEAENAAKDEALRLAASDIREWIKGTCPDDEPEERWLAEWGSDVLPVIEAALTTPPTGMVLVEREKLLEVYHRVMDGRTVGERLAKILGIEAEYLEELDS